MLIQELRKFFVICIERALSSGNDMHVFFLFYIAFLGHYSERGAVEMRNRTLNLGIFT